jgi:serine protease Do
MMSWRSGAGITRFAGVAGVAGVLALCGAAAGQGAAAQAKPDARAQPTTQAGDSDEAIARLRSDVRALISTARDKVFPALVNIEVVSLEYEGGKEAKGRSTGSGTIISPDGYVLTNAHVTDQGYRFWCVLADKQRVPARLIGEDPWTDLAVIKIDTDALDAGTKLASASFGDSDELEMGDYVLAMGSPFALSRTVTLGIVSNTERVFTSMGASGEIDEMMLNWEQRTGTFTNWIQHDALINPGNSGGPLVNLAGQIVGVNTRGGAGMAFATPSNMARQVAESLIRSGEVVRSTVGLSLRHLQNTGIDRGVLVDSVEIGSPAYDAGLRAGDVITAMDGAPVNVRFAEQVPALLRTIGDRPVGATVAVDYLRDGKEASASITTEKLLRDRGEEAALRTWGVTAQEITPRAAQLRKLPSTKGALVSSTRGGGPADQAEPKLNWGDVIRSVDGKPIETVKDLVEAYKKIDAMETKPEHVLIEFEREAKSFVTLLKPRPEDRPDPAPELAKAWVGVATQPVIPSLARQLAAAAGVSSPDDVRGFRVMRVYTGTQAAEAGLRVGDIITAINGTRLAPRGLQEAGLFNREVRRLGIDEPATLTVFRGDAATQIPITLERTRLEPAEVPRVRNQDFELVVRDITFFDRQDEKWDDSVKGVIVDSAEPAGWAGLAGVRPGDLIQRIDEHEITDAASYRKAMAAIAKERPSRVVFVVYRGVRTFFRFVEPEWTARTKEEKQAEPTSKED